LIVEISQILDYRDRDQGIQICHLSLKMNKCGNFGLKCERYVYFKKG